MVAIKNSIFKKMKDSSKKKDLAIKVKKFALYTLAGFGVFVIVIFFLKTFFPSPLPQFSNYGKVIIPLLGEKISSSPGAISSVSSRDNGQLPPVTENDAAGGEVVEEGELTQRKVVKNASLSLLVGKAEEAAESIHKIANELSGFVFYSEVYEVSEGTKAGTVTIRVPAQNFDEAISKIKSLSLKVEREIIGSQDVTESFFDLEAQLKNLKVEEEQYLKIMEKAEKIEDILSVSQYLGNVRGQIEQVQGQLEYLKRQTEMSSITVSLTSESDIEVFGLRWRPLFIVKQAFRSMLNRLKNYAELMIAVLFGLPVTLLWLGTISLAIFLSWRVVRWLARKIFKIGASKK